MDSNPSQSNQVQSESVHEKPYLTPVEISQDVSPGLVKSSGRRWWAVGAAVLLAGCAAAFFSYSSAPYIQNFGNGRRGPVEKFAVEFDEIDFDDSVRDFGATRRGYTVQVPVEIDSQEQQSQPAVLDIQR